VKVVAEGVHAPSSAVSTSPITAEPLMVGAGDVVKVPTVTATVSALETSADAVFSLVTVTLTLIL
jgi:hypothetical protein